MNSFHQWKVSELLAFTQDILLICLRNSVARTLREIPVHTKTRLPLWNFVITMGVISCFMRNLTSPSVIKHSACQAENQAPSWEIWY